MARAQPLCGPSFRSRPRIRAHRDRQSVFAGTGSTDWSHSGGRDPRSTGGPGPSAAPLVGAGGLPTAGRATTKPGSAGRSLRRRRPGSRTGSTGRTRRSTISIRWSLVRANVQPRGVAVGRVSRNRKSAPKPIQLAKPMSPADEPRAARRKHAAEERHDHGRRRESDLDQDGDDRVLLEAGDREGEGGTRDQEERQPERLGMNGDLGKGADIAREVRSPHGAAQAPHQARALGDRGRRPGRPPDLRRLDHLAGKRSCRSAPPGASRESDDGLLHDRCASREPRFLLLSPVAGATAREWYRARPTRAGDHVASPAGGTGRPASSGPAVQSGGQPVSSRR